jgi:hypothetical protein
MYAYEPMVAVAKEIRLVRIEPPTGTDEHRPIQLTIKRASLLDKPVFTALSYMWGDDISMHDIQIRSSDNKNTAMFSIRQNLYDFISIARHDSGEKWYWIDQICINQQDVSEKSQQVSQMAQVYSQAAMVEIWLGMSFEGSDQLFDRMSRDPPVTPQQEDQVKMADMRQNYASTLLIVTNNPYWERLWIFQEVALARSRLVRLGSKSVPWNKFLGGLGASSLSRKSPKRMEAEVSAGIGGSFGLFIKWTAGTKMSEWWDAHVRSSAIPRLNSSVIKLAKLDIIQAGLGAIDRASNDLIRSRSWTRTISYVAVSSVEVFL